MEGAWWMACWDGLGLADVFLILLDAGLERGDVDPFGVLILSLTLWTTISLVGV